MIKNNTSLKDMRLRKQAEEEKALLEAAEAKAEQMLGKDQLAEWRKLWGAIWFLVLGDAGNKIERLAVMRPIDRKVLSYASTKLEDDGLYGFLELCMREVWLGGDDDILEDDNYFIPAAQKFNKILEGKTAAFLKG